MLSKTLFINLILGCITSVCAQDRTVDSLRSSLATTSPAALSTVYTELAAGYIRTDHPDEAIRYARKAYQSASHYADSLAIVNAGSVLGQALERLGKLDSALILFSNMLPIAKRRHFDDAYEAILNSMAMAYTFKAQYDKALEQYFQCLQSKRGRGQTADVAFVLRDIGFVYYKLEDYATALQYFQQALQLKRDTEDPVFADRILINVSLCHAFTGDLTGARKILNDVLAEHRDETIVETFHALGIIQLKSNQLPEAEASFLRSLQEAVKKGEKRYQFQNIDALSDIYLRRNQLDLAEQYLKSVEPMAKDVSLNRERIALYFRFSTLYKRKDDYDKQAFYQEKYIQLKDSIFSDQLTNNLMQIESDYQEWKNKTQLLAQGQLLDLKNEVISRQNLLNILAGVIAVLLVVLVFALWKSNQQRTVANRKLDQKVQERTLELESSHRALRQEVEQRDVAVVKTITEINSAVATMRGLCSVGLKDGDDAESRKCLEEISAVTTRVSSALNRIQEDDDKREA